jgi:hypothetical protein
MEASKQKVRPNRAYSKKLVPLVVYPISLTQVLIHGKDEIHPVPDTSDSFFCTPDNCEVVTSLNSGRIVIIHANPHTKSCKQLGNDLTSDIYPFTSFSTNQYR